MDPSFNLADRIKKQLPAELLQVLLRAGEISRSLEMELYLVGGAVRDLLLGRPLQDLDLVVEGDAARLAEALAAPLAGRVVHHPHFKTASLGWGRWTVDVATSRSETYSQPGALPTVHAGDIELDLMRRDFTINAMAVCLAPLHYGNLLDPFGGKGDLEGKILRVLHDLSFRDDPTRIWRAIRYEQRLDFEIESQTRALLRRDLSYLSAISRDRLRHELELVLQEDKPEKTLNRAERLGVLPYLQPSLKAGPSLGRQFARLRDFVKPYSVPEDLYLAVLLAGLESSESEQFALALGFSKRTRKVLQDSSMLRAAMPVLAEPGLPDSRIYFTLCQFSLNAILANLFSTRSKLARDHIDRYLNHLRAVKPALTGEDLIGLDVKPGLQIKAALRLLLEARLAGQASSRQEEIKIIQNWRAGFS